MFQTPPLRITEDRTFSAQLGKRTVSGLAVASAWEGFIKYTNATGAHLIVLDAEQRVVAGTASLMSQLGLGEPDIGDQFGGGIFAGMTSVDGKPARLILLPGMGIDKTWDQAVVWAKAEGGELPTRAEMRTLYDNVKPHLDPFWHWSCEQHASFPSGAWVQYFDDGYQSYVLKSFEGRARAVRRLPI
ncbi:DUF1566 domain-containing protein [Oxalobacteraceae bacterium]|nr:DUF1566 domain-containing protein [Oxalobacteraceae bacterium]